MVPIQMYLFDKWSSGNLFYSTDFGLGGDFFTILVTTSPQIFYL